MLGLSPKLGYNRDSIVDAADYTVWRDTIGSTTNLRANCDNTSAGRRCRWSGRLHRLEVQFRQLCRQRCKW